MDLNRQPRQIDMSSTTAVECEAEGCESKYFDKVLMIRRVSKLITLETEDSMVPMETYKCTKCGHINKEFKLAE